MKCLRQAAGLRILAGMRFLLTTALLLAPLLSPGAGAQAQSWPQETGLQRDGFRGSIDAFDRFRMAENPRLQGEDARERVGGWVGAARGWLENQYDKIGQNDGDSQRHFNLRREWEGDVGRRR